METFNDEVLKIDQELESHPVSSLGNVSQTVRGETEIQNWLTNYLAQLLEITPDEIDITISFDCYSLDSAAAVGLSGDLEEWLGSEFEPTLLYDYPTIETLAKYLTEECQATKSLFQMCETA